MKEENLLKESVVPITKWFAENGRALPWREEASPYHVWVSEIMLQQTRISAVIPYYHRFLKELPTVKDLASVEDDRLLKLWEGLGYYSRARNLKKAAQVVMRDHGGELPKSFDSLHKLPGIGDYTAGAIASIAFGLPTPAVDGNVLRVLSRLTGSTEDVTLPKTKAAMISALQKIYPSGRDASLLTQGLMELGETICLPNGVPLCENCPLQPLCVAHSLHKECDFPKRSAKKLRRVERRCVLLLRCENRYALEKRTEKGLLAGLWQFPNLPGQTEEEILPYLAECNLQVQSFLPLGSATHIFTHIEWQMTGYEITVSNPSPCFEWKTKEEILLDTPLPSAFRYYVKKLR